MAASENPLAGERRAPDAALCACARAWVDPAPAPVHAPRRPLRRSLSLPPPRPPLPAPGPAPVLTSDHAAVTVTLGPPPAYDDQHRSAPPGPLRLAVGHPEPPPPYSPAGIFCVSTAPGDRFDGLPVARQPAPCRYADEGRSTGVYCCVITWTVLLVCGAAAQYFWF